MMAQGKFAIYVRPVIALAFAGAIVVGFFMDKVSVDYIYGMATGVFSYYFDPIPKP
jgi:hypothetical protein